MTQPSKRLRIDEVAKLAGVSPATVSRVMNGSRRVSPDNRKRVLDTAQRFDYQPSQLARNLRRGQTASVGVLVSDIENPHFATMVRAIEATLYAHGKRVLLCNTAEDSAKQSSYLEMVAAERVMGVIISPTADGDASVSRLMDLGIPVVAFDRPVADARADAIVTNNFEGSASATRHLIESGRRAVGFLGGRDNVWTTAERLGGYRYAMESAGLPMFTAVGPELTVEAGYEAANRLLAQNPRLDALLIANNQMTIGALGALRAGGIRLPDQLGIVAFDDPPWASLLDPPLTTLAQPLKQMSEAAVNRLFLRMADSSLPPQRICFECHLEIRQSSQSRQDPVRGV